VREIQTSTTVADLAPASYQVLAFEATVAPNTYQPQQASQTAQVTRGATATVTVTYGLIAPRLVATSNGLPGGLAPNWALGSASSLGVLIPANGRIDNLAAGNAVLRAGGVLVSGQLLAPTPAVAPLTMATGVATAATINWGPVTPVELDPARNGTGGSPVTGLTASTGTGRFFRLAVPAGTTRLRVMTGGAGATGNADLHVHNAAPAGFPSSVRCSSQQENSSTESCVIDNPEAGTWWIQINAVAGYQAMTLSADLTTPVPQATITIAGTGTGGTGRLVSAPAGIDCTVTNGTAAATGCSASFNEGSQVVLSVPSGGGTVAAWGGACGGTDAAAACQLTASGTMSVQVTFLGSALNLQVFGGGPGTGSGTIAVSSNDQPVGECAIVDGIINPGCANFSIPAGSAVRLQAAQGTIDSWGGECVGTAKTAPCQFTMNSAKNVLVSFEFPAEILPATKTPVVTTTQEVTSYTFNIPIANAGGGTLDLRVGTPTASWLTASLQGNGVALTITPNSETRPQRTPYEASVRVSAPPAADVQIVVKYFRQQGFVSGMASRIVRFHRASGTATEDEPPVGLSASVAVIDRRNGTKVSNITLRPVFPADYNWLQPPTLSDGRVQLRVKGYDAGDGQIPLGSLPSGGDPIGTPIKIRVTTSDCKETDASSALNPDCQLFVYYTSDPWPRILLRDWGVLLTPAAPTQTSTIETQPGNPGTSLDPATLFDDDCGTLIVRPIVVSGGKVTVTGNFAAVGTENYATCNIRLRAVYREDGAEIGTDLATLKVTLSRPAPDALTGSAADFNVLAIRGSADTAISGEVTIHNFGPSIITLKEPTITPAGAVPCPPTLLKMTRLTNTRVGIGSSGAARVKIGLVSQTAALRCDAQLRFEAVTAGIVPLDIPVKIVIK
jgi:hypothetical protein